MFATIYLPDFFLQSALRHQSLLWEKPVVLLDDLETKATIIALNEPAIRAGVQKGMTASQGLARCEHLIIKTRRRPQEEVLDQLLLQHAFALSPYVEATGPGICTVQFTGQRAVTQKVVTLIELLLELGVTAQAGIGPSPDLSRLAAHVAQPVAQVDDEQAFLAPLPIESLDAVYSE